MPTKFFDRPLDWDDGPRTMGCKYHKKATFAFIGATGQLDVFVMPRIARSRPVAITLNVTTKTAGKKTLRGSLRMPSDALGLRSRLTPRLVGVGLSADRAAFVVDSLIRFVENEAAPITKALASAAKQAR